jgi:holliday junction DNA helicase RuvA
MISYLKGSIEQIQRVSNTKTIAIVEVSGVGYEVQVPSNIPLTVGAPAQVFTHQQFREDLVSLYGFATVTERDLFRQLIGVSGIGASIGIGLIENLGTTELVQAIVLGSAKILAKTPGVGLKTAERLTVELKDKLKQWHDVANLATLELDESLDRGLQGEVEATLLALGYSDIEVRQALFAIGQNEQVAKSTDLEEWLRWAIASLS